MVRGSENETSQAEPNTQFEGPSVSSEERKEIIERFRSYLMLLKRWANRDELEDVSFAPPGED